MIEKEIKEYSQGNKTIQRINILKQDNIKGTVFILKPDEYNSLKAENKQLQEETLKQKELILELTSQMKKMIYSMKI